MRTGCIIYAPDCGHLSMPPFGFQLPAQAIINNRYDLAQMLPLPLPLCLSDRVPNSIRLAAEAFEIWPADPAMNAVALLLHAPIVWASTWLVGWPHATQRRSESSMPSLNLATN